MAREQGLGPALGGVEQVRGEARRPRAQQIGGRTVRGGRRRARRCALLELCSRELEEGKGRDGTGREAYRACTRIKSGARRARIAGAPPVAGWARVRAQ